MNFYTKTFWTATLFFALFCSMVQATQLHQDAKYGNIEGIKSYCYSDQGIVAKLKRAVGMGPNVDIEDEQGNTPLHLAVIYGQLEAAKLLLENGANVNEKGVQGVTALTMATINRFPEMVKLLLDKGANVDAPDWSGATPLIIAARWGNNDIAETLIQHGAKVNAQEVITKETPLHSVFHFLLPYSIQRTVSMGETIAITVVYKSILPELLLDPEYHRFEDDHFITAENKDNKRRIIQLLLDSGADTNIKNMNGKTPVDYATEAGFSDIATLLKDQK